MNIKKVRVCHIAPVHSDEDGRVFRRACVSLAEAGYEVHLFAFSNKKEVYEKMDVTIHPVNYKNRAERFLERDKVVSKAVLLEPDIIHVHDPEILGNVIAKSRNVPVIFDIHEFFLDVLADREWIPKPMRPILKTLWDYNERKLIKKCNSLIVATEGIAKRYKNLGYEPVLVSNFPSLDEINSLCADRSDNFYCVYAGSIMPDTGLEYAVQAFKILKKKGIKIKFEIAGGSDESYINKLKRIIVENDVSDLVEYHGVLPRAEAIKLVSSASLGFMLYLPFGNNMVAIPNKIFEYMAYSIPFIYSGLPLVSQILDSENVGVKVDPYNPHEIADAIEMLYRNPDICQDKGMRGKKIVMNRYNWDNEKGKLLGLYEKIVNERHTER